MRPALLSCLRYTFEHEKTKDVVFKIISAKRVSFPRLAPKIAAYHLTARATTQGVTIPVSIDFVVMGRHRALAGLFAAGYVKPFPRAQVVGLARAMASRLP